MFHHWLLREPSLCFGLPVYIFAAILFPLHLGWIGSPLLSFVGYVVVAAVLFSIVDAVFQPSFYRNGWPLFLNRSSAFVPAALAFSLGAALGPVDEAIDEETCASQGAAEVDTIAAESDDTFDMTADCATG